MVMPYPQTGRVPLEGVVMGTHIVFGRDKTDVPSVGMATPVSGSAGPREVKAADVTRGSAA